MFQHWKNDFMSSIVVFLVALPLCLGIALASNAPLAAGLFAGILGGIVIGSLSGSPLSVSGPAAGLTVIVVNGIAQLGSFETFTLAVLMAGIFQILFGVLRGGVIGNYFPTAVIKGMLAAIGVILILKQYSNALGLQKGWTIGAIFSYMHVGILLISILSIALMLFWEKQAAGGAKLFKLLPGALVAVVSSIVLNALYNSAFPQLALNPEHLVQLPFNGFSELFGSIHLPDFTRIFDPLVLKVAITIAIVASLETLLCVDAADKIDPEKRKTSKDRELLAQGAGNIVSGLIGALPLTAVIVRSSANVTAGAKTKLSAILHGVWIIVCVALIPGILNMIPLASLACILLLTGYKLCKPTHFKEMKARGNDQLFVFVATIVAIIATDLLVGIGIGLALAIVLEANKLKLSPFTISHESEQSVLEFTQNVSFIHKAKIGKTMSAVPSGKTLHIKGMKNVKLHVDVHEMIHEQKQDLAKREITTIIH